MEESAVPPLVPGANSNNFIDISQLSIPETLASSSGLSTTSYEINNEEGRYIGLSKDYIKKEGFIEGYCVEEGQDALYFSVNSNDSYLNSLESGLMITIDYRKTNSERYHWDNHFLTTLCAKRTIQVGTNHKKIIKPTEGQDMRDVAEAELRFDSENFLSNTQYKQWRLMYGVADMPEEQGQTAAGYTWLEQPDGPWKEFSMNYPLVTSVNNAWTSMTLFMPFKKLIPGLGNEMILPNMPIKGKIWQPTKRQIHRAIRGTFITADSANFGSVEVKISLHKSMIVTNLYKMSERFASDMEHRKDIIGVPYPYWSVREELRRMPQNVTYYEETIFENTTAPQKIIVGLCTDGELLESTAMHHHFGCARNGCIKLEAKFTYLNAEGHYEDEIVPEIEDSDVVCHGINVVEQTLSALWTVGLDNRNMGWFRGGPADPRKLTNYQHYWFIDLTPGGYGEPKTDYPTSKGRLKLQWTMQSPHQPLQIYCFMYTRAMLTHHMKNEIQFPEEDNILDVRNYTITQPATFTGRGTVKNRVYSAGRGRKRKRH